MYHESFIFDGCYCPNILNITVEVAEIYILNDRPIYKNKKVRKLEIKL